MYVVYLGRALVREARTVLIVLAKWWRTANSLGAFLGPTALFCNTLNSLGLTTRSSLRSLRDPSPADSFSRPFVAVSLRGWFCSKCFSNVANRCLCQIPLLYPYVGCEVYAVQDTVA